MSSKLFDAQTSNGTSSEIDYSAEVTISAFGVFDGARVVIDVSDDDGTTFQPVHQFHQDGKFTLTLSGGSNFKFRSRVLDAGSSTSVTVVEGSTT